MPFSHPSLSTALVDSRWHMQAQDTEGYKKLLDEKKDSRKTFLLDKIDERLRIMGSKIKQHQLSEKQLERKLKKQQVRACVCVLGGRVGVRPCSLAHALATSTNRTSLPPKAYTDTHRHRHMHTHTHTHTHAH